MIMNLNHNLKVLNNSLSILQKWIIPKISTTTAIQEQYNCCAKYWIDKQSSYLSKNGVKWTCSRAKLVRAITLNFIAGTPIRVVGEFISINKKGIPSDLGPLGALLLGRNDHDLKFLLTLLSVTKVLKDQARPNYDSIIGPARGIVSEDWEIYINRFFRSLRVRKHSLKHEWSEYHLSTKTSPNGGLALSDSLSEVFALKANMSLFESIKKLGGNKLSSRLDKLSTMLRPDLDLNFELRRVTPIADKEGKTRVVAILDYWSQTALKPLHNSLLGLLKSIKSDMTFDQDAFSRDLKSGPYFSFDLKDATDRFPISLQKKVLSYLIGEDNSEAWASILIQKDYRTPEGNRISYNTGQPMGGYSSWAAFAVTHHIVVQRAAMETKKFPFSNYYLLGDDIVICDQVVASRYESLMLELGIEFSKTKTFKSDTLFEFASRVFLNKIEISPFSLTGVMESAQHPATIVEFLRTMQRHGWNLLKEGNVPGQIRSLMRITGNSSFARWNPLINIFHHLPLQEVVKNKVILPKGRALLNDISCFEHQQLPLLRQSLILELRSRVETSIDKITELHAEWAITLPKSLDFIRSDTGEIPIAPGVIPFIGVWHDLKRKARDIANELSSYYYEFEEDIPLEKWVSDLTDLNNTPNVNQALKERKHKLLTLTYSSLILSSFNRVRKHGIEISE